MLRISLWVLGILTNWRTLVGVTAVIGTGTLVATGAVFFGYLNPDTVSYYAHNIADGGQYALAAWTLLGSGVSIRKIAPMLYAAWTNESPERKLLRDLTSLQAEHPTLLQQLPALLRNLNLTGSPGPNP